MKLLLTNSGWEIRDVKVQCFTNKVIYKGIYGLAFDRFTRLTEYAVPDVKDGESFPADCYFAWSFWTKPTDGIFVYGRDVTASAGPYMGILVVFRNDGVPMLRPGTPVPAKMTADLTGYSYNQITAVDGSFVVEYRWPHTFWVQRRVIHVVARRSGDELKWRVAPESEPVIPDPEGWTVLAKSTSKEWGITMGRYSP